MFHYNIHVPRGLSELIVLISIDNVPALCQNKYSKNNRVNYLPTQISLKIFLKWCISMWSKFNIFWITKKAFDLWVFLCMISAEFCYLALVDTWRFSKSTWSLNRQVTWKSRWGPFTLTHNPNNFDGHWCYETGDAN